MLENFPVDVCLKILCSLDHRDLAAAQLVCRKWRSLASENTLWFKLFTIRWGKDSAEFYAPEDSKSWKDVYIVQDRCDRIGLGLRIIREGEDYYLVHQGEIQRHLGRSKPETREMQENSDGITSTSGEFSSSNDEPCAGILDKILFFIGDLENASAQAQRS